MEVSYLFDFHTIHGVPALCTLCIVSTIKRGEKKMFADLVSRKVNLLNYKKYKEIISGPLFYFLIIYMDAIFILFKHGPLMP